MTGTDKKGRFCKKDGFAGRTVLQKDGFVKDGFVKDVWSKRTGGPKGRVVQKDGWSKRTVLQ